MRALREKKSYLIDFSFKFNAIKFCNLLMNWLMWEKMLTCSYNKFRPLIRMHHVKCAVNSLLLTLLWLLQKVCGTLDRCFATTHTVLSMLSGVQIHFCMIIRETRHHAQAYVTLRALVNCGLSLAAR